MPFATTWMKLEIITPSKRDRERQIYDMAQMWNLKEKDTDELTHKTQTDPQTQTTSLWSPNGKAWRGINQKFWINIVLLYTKQITNRDILGSPGNYTQYFVITYKGKKYEKEFMYVCVYMGFAECVYIYLNITDNLAVYLKLI